MNRYQDQTTYQQRLTIFLGQIQAVQQRSKKDDLYSIMDTVPFRDLETALMMATMETGNRR